MSPTYERFISALDDVTELDSLNNLFLKKISQYGFDRMALCLNSDHKEIGLKAEVGIVNNLSETWMKYYMQEEFFKIDPVLQLARSKDEIFRWSDTAREMKLFPKQEYFFKLVKDAGLHNGYYIPIWGHNTMAGIGISRSVSAENTDVDVTMITAYCRQYYSAFVNLHKRIHAYGTPKKDASVLLTAREKEILKLAAKGLRDAEIGRMLNLSPHTVDAHFRSIYKKLPAKTRTEAVASAISDHLIWI